MTDKQNRKVLDLTPSWSTTLRYCLGVIRDSTTPESIKIAEEHLQKMALIADEYVALVASPQKTASFEDDRPNNHHPDCPANDGFGCRCEELYDKQAGITPSDRLLKGTTMKLMDGQYEAVLSDGVDLNIFIHHPVKRVADKTADKILTSLINRQNMLAALQDAYATLDRWTDNPLWDTRDDQTYNNVQTAINNAR